MGCINYGLLWYMYTWLLKFFRLSTLGRQACVSLCKVWLVTLTDENVLASIIGNMLDLCLYHSEGILPTEMPVNCAKS